MAYEQVIKNSQHKMINLWDVQTWQSAYQLAPLGNLLVSPDSRFLLGYSWRTFDLTTRKEIRPSAENFGRGTLSPNAERLATLDKAGFVSFWDLRRFWTLGERRLIARYAAHRDGGRAIAYSPDGRMVATGSDNIIVWDAETHAKIARFPYRDLANDLAFSPDSKRLFSAHGDGAILEWDLAEKEMARNFAEHSGVVRTVSFSADGKTLASASEDRSIILWDAETGLKRGALSGLGAPFAAAVLSADGKLLVSADIYGQITVWDTMTRAPLRSFALLRKDGSSLNFCLAVSPDQKWATTTYGLYSIADGRLVVDFCKCKTPTARTFAARLFRRMGVGWCAWLRTGAYIGGRSAPGIFKRSSDRETLSRSRLRPIANGWP
jgi:WD40 repeat protein